MAVTFCPFGATKTTLAVAPSAVAPGKRCSIRSNAFWDSMPGIENPSSAAPGAFSAPSPTAARTAAQTRATYQRRLKARRPTR